MDTRRKARYEATAKRLGLELGTYLYKGSKGSRFCTICRRWKHKDRFLLYSYTKTHYAGVCIICRGKAIKPAEVKGKSWGPSVRAAAATKVSAKEYITLRESGQRWCSDHKGWFNASEILGSKRYKGGTITRCLACNRSRARRR